MLRTIKFYDKKGKWYADLPDYIAQGGSEEECEMIEGADTWLDKLSNYGRSITLTISDKVKLKEKLFLQNEEEFGATYKEVEYGHILWLCNVTKFVFGDFPIVIYYEVKN
jgi:hypothetical protein